MESRESLMQTLENMDLGGNHCWRKLLPNISVTTPTLMVAMNSRPCMSSQVSQYIALDCKICKVELKLFGICSSKVINSSTQCVLPAAIEDTTNSVSMQVMPIHCLVEQCSVMVQNLLQSETHMEEKNTLVTGDGMMIKIGHLNSSKK